MERPIALFLCGCGWGAPNHYTALGPYELYPAIKDIMAHAHVYATLYHHPHKLETGHRFTHPSREPFYPQHIAALRHHQDLVYHAVKAGAFPIVLGGDHSIAMATWSGIRKAREVDFGLMWFDAHMDANTLDTTPSNAPHGMPLAVLLGEDVPNYSHLVAGIPPLKGGRLAQFGLRAYDRGEEQTLQAHGAHIYTMEAIKAHGFIPCYEAGFAAIATQGPDFGVSIDIDGFDPTCAPGTGMHEPGGIDPAEIMPLVKGLARSPHCVGLEIAEINLHNDEEGKTVKVIQALLEKVCEA